MALEDRVSTLEAGEIVTDRRLDDLEAWRDRDEPRTLKLVQDAQIADEVRQALREAGARRWSRLEKIGALALGAVTFAGSIAELLHAIGAL